MVHSGAGDSQSNRNQSDRTTTTTILVNYIAPEGQKYLPIVLNDQVTMVHLGQHDGEQVFEPTDMILGSPEDGLRYHHSMSATDMFEGPFDLAPWGRPVVGPISSDQLWLINPQPYDPTKSPSKKGENLPVADQLPTPQSQATILGHTSAVADVDIGMLAELGTAVTRGAAQAARSTGENPAQGHSSQPVPDSDPATPIDSGLPSPIQDAVSSDPRTYRGPLISNEAWARASSAGRSTSLISRAS